MSLASIQLPRASSLSPSYSRLGSGPLNRVKRLEQIHHRSDDSLSNKPNEFEIVPVGNVDSKYICPVCTQLLRYPLQFEECGHRCCSACLPEILRVAPRCPIDQTKIDRNKMYIDRGLQRELDAVTVRCSYHTNGCQWTGELRNLMTHSEDCAMRSILCPKECGMKVGKSSMSNHLQDLCPNRSIVCVCCHASIKSKEEMEHMRNCAQFPVFCPNGCGIKELPRSKMPDHLRECKKQPSGCPYASAGCKHQCLLRDVAVHLTSNYEEHLLMVKEAILKASETDLQTRVTELMNRVSMLQARLENLRKIHAPVALWKIEEFDEQCRKARSVSSSALLSPHMSNRRHGYRLQMHAYLNGDDIVQSRFMSVHLSICQNDNDCCVNWPFASKVTITLLDQCDNPSARNHVSHVLDPTTITTKGAFDRPRRGNNPLFGVTKFIHLDDLFRRGHYVKEDAIFLHVKIDD